MEKENMDSNKIVFSKKLLGKFYIVVGVFIGISTVVMVAFNGVNTVGALRIVSGIGLSIFTVFIGINRVRNNGQILNEEDKFLLRKEKSISKQQKKQHIHKTMKQELYIKNILRALYVIMIEVVIGAVVYFFELRGLRIYGLKLSGLVVLVLFVTICYLIYCIMGKEYKRLINIIVSANEKVEDVNEDFLKGAIFRKKAMVLVVGDKYTVYFADKTSAFIKNEDIVKLRYLKNEEDYYFEGVYTGRTEKRGVIVSTKAEQEYELCCGEFMEPLIVEKYQSQNSEILFHNSKS